MRGARTRNGVRPPLAGLALLGASLLGGCAEMHHGFEAVARTTRGPASAAAAPVDAAEAGGPRVVTAAPRAGPVRVAAIPSPRDIFDFHHARARPDDWRQPFLIDPNDGPLAADVRRSAAELRAYRAGMKAGTETAKRRCGETEVAAAKPGCAGLPAKGAAASPPPRTAAQGD